VKSLVNAVILFLSLDLHTVIFGPYFVINFSPRVTDNKLFQAIVDQCTENTKKKKSSRDFASTPLLFFLEPFLSVLLL